MHTLKTEELLVGNYLNPFLKDNPTVDGYAQRFDGDLDHAFAGFPHIDLYLWHKFGSHEQCERPMYTEHGVARLAKLTIAELLLLAHFAESLAIQIGNMEVVLSRYEAGRCSFVLYRKDK